MLKRRWMSLACFGALALAFATFGGCYRHVVKASGPTSKQYDIYEPNLRDDQVDGLIFGSEGSKKKKN